MLRNLAVIALFGLSAVGIWLWFGRGAEAAGRRKIENASSGRTVELLSVNSEWGVTGRWIENSPRDSLVSVVAFSGSSSPTIPQSYSPVDAGNGWDEFVSWARTRNYGKKYYVDIADDESYAWVLGVSDSRAYLMTYKFYERF
jgi:hypothetical protein